MAFLINRCYRTNYLASCQELSEKEKSVIELLLDSTDKEEIESIEYRIKSITQQALDVLLYLSWCEYNFKIIRILFPYSTRIPCPLGLSLLLNLVFNRYQQDEAVEYEIKQSYMVPYHDVLLLLSIKAKNQKVLTILLKLIEKTLIESTIQSMTDEY